MKFRTRTAIAFLAVSSLLACFNEGSGDGGASGAPIATGGAPQVASGGKTGSGTSASGTSSGGTGQEGGSSAAGSPGGAAGSPATGGTGGATVGTGGTSEVGGTGGEGAGPTAGAGNTTANNGMIRMIVSSDIGGTDNDDYQSMAHLFVYLDQFQLEGLVASPHGDGRAKHYHEAIDAYEQDYPKLKTYSDNYPTPEALRAMVKQGHLDKIGAPGWGEPTDGSRLIVERANAPDPRPLWVTVWGSIDDIAQACHDDPSIASKIRVYWIGGPNKKHSPNSYPYLDQNHKDLWIIENNTTYRGFFNGGDMSGDLSNSNFPRQHIAGHGAIGKYFMDHRADVKMGDTPSITYLLKAGGNVPEDPSKPGWGGQFVPRAGYPNWWTDDTSSAAEDAGYPGAKHVSKWRTEFLRDYEKMSDRAQAAKP